jgi:hypothetical protein
LRFGDEWQNQVFLSQFLSPTLNMVILNVEISLSLERALKRLDANLGSAFKASCPSIYE